MTPEQASCALVACLVRAFSRFVIYTDWFAASVRTCPLRVIRESNTRLMRLIADERHDHAVQIEEEHDEVETELDEGFLLMHIQLPKDLSRIK